MKHLILLFLLSISNWGYSQVNLPITFEETATVDYELSDFGGNMSSIVTDPTDPNNTVGQAIKTNVAEIWAGTTLSLIHI